MNLIIVSLFLLPLIRGDSYNGYPNDRGYFGSFCFDGLAVALHSFAHSTSPASCLQRCINYCGDCDSTGSVAGQLAGAFYGACAMPAALLSAALRWDGGENLLRAVMLSTAFRTTLHEMLRLGHSQESEGQRDKIEKEEREAVVAAAAVMVAAAATTTSEGLLPSL